MIEGFRQWWLYIIDDFKNQEIEKPPTQSSVETASLERESSFSDFPSKQLETKLPLSKRAVTLFRNFSRQLSKLSGKISTLFSLQFTRNEKDLNGNVVPLKTKMTAAPLSLSSAILAQKKSSSIAEKILSRFYTVLATTATVTMRFVMILPYIVKAGYAAHSERKILENNKLEILNQNPQATEWDRISLKAGIIGSVALQTMKKIGRILADPIIGLIQGVAIFAEGEKIKNSTILTMEGESGFQKEEGSTDSQASRDISLMILNLHIFRPISEMKRGTADSRYEDKKHEFQEKINIIKENREYSSSELAKIEASFKTKLNNERNKMRKAGNLDIAQMKKMLDSHLKEYSKLVLLNLDSSISQYETSVEISKFKENMGLKATIGAGGEMLRSMKKNRDQDAERIINEYKARILRDFPELNT